MLVLRVMPVIAAIAMLTAGCATQANRPAPRQTVAARDPDTVSALLSIARAFNDEYGRGDYGPVYDRWDPRSQAIIARADYIRRHTECATAPQGPARVESAARGPKGAWLVRYEIGGYQFVDYWFYVHGRWVFDILLSNPASAKLYRLPAGQYAKAVGCAH